MVVDDDDDADKVECDGDVRVMSALIFAKWLWRL